MIVVFSWTILLKAVINLSYSAYLPSNLGNFKGGSRDEFAAPTKEALNCATSIATEPRRRLRMPSILTFVLINNSSLSLRPLSEGQSCSILP